MGSWLRAIRSPQMHLKWFEQFKALPVGTPGLTRGSGLGGLWRGHSAVFVPMAALAGPSTVFPDFPFFFLGSCLPALPPPFILL